ncbi:MAG: hypothetical protein JNJ57_01015 [Saprospiraceae bacterium]|nr:hypothetical protein [Saprospiraceae bacterium]
MLIHILAWLISCMPMHQPPPTKPAPPEYTVTFYANISDTNGEFGWVGHVWVSFNSPQIQTVVGFYPSGLSDDSWRPYDVSYPFSVSAEQFQSGLAVIDAYRNKHYLLGFSDCRGFTANVAQAIGLTPPSTGIKSPAEWLGALVQINRP